MTLGPHNWEQYGHKSVAAFDKHYKNGFGVILDDIIAGLYTVLTLIILNAFI